MSESKRRIRVGALIAVSAIGLALALVALKGGMAFLGATVELEAAFDDVGGMVPGATVRLAGVKIGQVSEVYLPPGDNRVVVRMDVDRTYLPRIRKDSVATIGTRGLLGDPLIEIGLGSPDAGEVHDGDRLKSEGPRGLKAVVATLQEGVSNVEEISELMRERLTAIFTDELATDVGRIAHSTADIIEGIEKGPSLAHDLIYDEKLRGEATRTLATVRRALLRLEGAVTSTERILAEVETGDGILHAAIYDERAKNAVKELSGAMEELHRLLGDLRSGSGGAGIREDLRVAAETLHRLMDEIDQGKGTIGGLLKDPTIYRDLRQLLGEVRRNVILKSVVRMTIAKDRLERE